MPTNNTTNCIMCDHDELTPSTEESAFSYGAGKNKTTIHALVSLLTCNNCGFIFTSEDGNLAEHNAVCAHLERLNPLEILSLREKLGLTQNGFAEITGFSPATIHRWEVGSKIQSASSDLLLRIICKLYAKFKDVEKTITFLKADKTKQPDDYSWDVSEKETTAADNFELRLAA